jgi:two-component system, OmpR family, sensor kinase
VSMRRRLLFWLLSTVLVAGLVATAVVFYQARQQANELFDYQLRQLAMTLRDRTFEPSGFAEAVQNAEGQDFVIDVWSADGRLIYESHPNILVPQATQPGFADISTRIGTWRVFSTWYRGLTIQVAQYKLAREALALGAAWRTLAPFLLALPLMGWLIWHLVGREVKVLETTAQAVAKRTPESLEPIESKAVPEEVQPLVDALNGLMARLGGALSQQRQFIADAAHELRTPLTALRLQLQLAERARDAEERAKAHAMLYEGITRATHVVEQLLTLARADPEATAAGWSKVDLAELAHGVVLSHGAEAEAKGMALNQDVPAPVVVEGDRAALRTMMDNLVDNAVRHTAAGAVTVRARREGQAAIFEVEDSGPGIPAEERERVFARFYRGESAAEGGSGLGLAIARRIVERHGGKIELLEGPGGQGLRVRVTLSPS